MFDSYATLHYCTRRAERRQISFESWRRGTRHLYSARLVIDSNKDDFHG